MSEPLLDALDRLRGTGPEFNGFLANHGPMATEALTHIGGADAIPAWVEKYRPRLDVAPEVRQGIDADDWRNHLGDERLFGDWTALMREQAAEAPWREVLLRWWPRLLPGLAASATHGVIRTAHAVRSLHAAGDDPDPLLVDELAQGLGFWAARYQSVPGAPMLRGASGAVASLAKLPRLDPDVPSEGAGISGRLRALQHADGFAAGLDEYGAPPDPDAALDDLIGAAARVLAAREDVPIAFCHAVTAPAAIRMVLPELTDELQRASVAAAWQVIGAIVAAFASPRLAAEQDAVTDELDPTELAALAIDNGDEHVIKLTEAASREFARTGDATLLVAADRFRRR